MTKFELLPDLWKEVKMFAGIYEIPNMNWPQFDRFVNTAYLIAMFRKHFGKAGSESINDFIVYDDYDYTNCNALSGLSLLGKDVRCIEEKKVRTTVLRNIASGWKSEAFYNDILLLGSKTVNCICGSVYPRKHWRYYNIHYSSNEHIEGAFGPNNLEKTKNRIIHEYNENPKLFHYSKQYDFCVRLSRNHKRLVTHIDSNRKIIINLNSA